MTATVHERSGSVAGSGDGALPPSWRHPLAVALTSVEAALDEVADAGCWSLSDAELAGLVDQAWSVRSRLDEVCLRLATAADTRDPGEAFAATSTTGWLRASQRVSRRAAAAEVRLGTALDQRCPVTRAALSAGEVNTEQAAVIVAAMGRLPRDVTDTQRRACEAHLVDLAATFGLRSCKSSVDGCGRRSTLRVRMLLRGGCWRPRRPPLEPPRSCTCALKMTGPPEAGL